MTTQSRLSALAFTAAALTTAMLVADGASALPGIQSRGPVPLANGQYQPGQRAD